MVSLCGGFVSFGFEDAELRESGYTVHEREATVEATVARRMGTLKGHSETVLSVCALDGNRPATQDTTSDRRVLTACMFNL